MRTGTTVLFVTSSMKIGGAEKITVDLIMGLDGKGFKTALICLKTLGYWGEYLLEQGIECHVLGIKRQWNFLRLSTLIRLCKLCQPHIIYSLDHRDALFWSRLLAFFLRCPHVLSVHSLKIAGAEAPDRLLYEIMIKTTTPLSAKIVVVGRSVRDYLISIGISRKKIEVIHNGVQVYDQIGKLDSSDWRSKLGISTKERLVGIVASLRPIKAHDVFLKAAELILGSCPKTYFAIIGDGYLRSYLEQLARSLKIPDHVFFLGKITPANGIIRALDVGVLSSKQEAFPMVVLEYMEAGKPGVSTNIGGPSEIILDGQTGFLVPPNRPELLAQKIIFLLKNERIARRMGQEGRKRVKRLYSLEEMIEKNVVLFDQLVK